VPFTTEKEKLTENNTDCVYSIRLQRPLSATASPWKHS